MDDQAKTKQQLIDELVEMRRKFSEIEAGYPVTDICEIDSSAEALRKSDERLELALKGADLGLWDYNLETGYAFVNERRAEMVGYALEEAEPHITWWGKQVHPEDVHKVRKAFNSHVKGRIPLYECEHRLRHKSGHYIWILARGKVVEWDKQGNPLRLVGTSLDITDRKKTEEALEQAHNELERRVQERTSELVSINRQLKNEIVQRKRAEDELRKSEEKYRLLAENATDIVWTLDLKTQEFTYISPSVEKIRGYTSAEAIELPLDKTLTPDSYALAMDVLAKELGRDSDPGVRPDRIGLLEFREFRKDGSIIDTELRIKFLRDANGIPHSVLGITRNVTERKHAEEALRQSEEKYRLMFDYSPLGVFHFDATGTITACNDNFVRIIGSSREQLIGLNTINDLNDEKMMASIKEALSGIMGHYEGYYTSVTAIKTTPVKCEFGPIMDREMGVTGGIGIIEDISDRKRSEDALRKSEEKFKDLFDNSTDLMYTHDMAGNFSSVNKAAETLLGYTSEEFLKLNFRQIVDPDYLSVTEKNFRMIANGLADQTGPYEVLVLTKSGQPVWLELNSRIILDRGERVGVHGTARDITDRKRDQKDLKRLFAAVEQAGETIVITDQSGLIQYVNPCFELTTGYTREEAIGQDVRILQSGRHDKSFYQQIWKTLAGGEVWRGRFTNRKKDGTEYEETATLSPIRDETGKILSFVKVGRDVTSEVLLQKQLLHAQKMEAIGTLAGGMAHDFNNMLQAIIGYSDLLLMQKREGDSDRKKLQVIQQAAQDGADLVSSLLTFSRKADSKRRPVDLNEVIRKAQRLLIRTIPLMIEIRLVLSENLWIIDADPAQMEQVLINLAVNAQHAMPDGGQLLIETSNVSLSDEYLRTHLEARAGRYVLLTVSDTGEGMEAGVLDRIFEPFFTTKVNGEGTGLGLSMVHGIVSQHGGYIGCYSEPGKGTSFKIYLPVSDRELDRDFELTREMPAFGTETILLVDDDDRIRVMGKQMIEMGGYKVLIAKSGEEALEIYSSHKEAIALVILDVIMPGMGGKRCLEELLRMDLNVRVLFASGYSSNGLAMGEGSSGARGFVSKPYDAKEILTAIRRVLDKGRL